MLGPWILTNCHYLLAFGVANCLMNLSLTVLSHNFPTAIVLLTWGRALSLDVLGLYDFFNASITFWLMMAVAKIESRKLRLSLLAAFGYAFLMTFLWACLFAFFDFQIKLNEEILVCLLELLDIGFRILKKVDFVSFKVFNLCVESVSVKLQLVFNLGVETVTEIRFLISVSWCWRSCSSLLY